MADADLQIKFGADASALQSGLGAVKGALDGLSSSVGNLRSAFDGLSGAIAQPTSSVNTLSSALKSASAEAKNVWNIFQQPMDGLHKINEDAKDIKTSIGLVKDFGGVVKDLGVKLGLLQTAETAAAAGMTAVDAAADANPVGAVVVAVAAVVAGVAALAVGLKQLYDTNSTAKASFDALGEIIRGVAEVFGALWDDVVLVVKIYLDLCEGVANLIGLGVKAKIDEWRQDFDVWKGVVEAVLAVLLRVIDAIGTFLAKKFGPEIDVITTAWNNIKQAVSDVAGTVTGALKTAFDWLSHGLGDLMTKIGDLIAKNFPDIVAQWSKTLNDLAKSFADVAAGAERLWEVLTGKKTPTQGSRPPAASPSGQPKPQSETRHTDGGSGQHHGGHAQGGGAQGRAGGGKADCAQAAADCEAKALDAKIAADQQKLAADQANTAAMDADMAQYLADLKARYGEDSDQYKQALGQKNQATAQFSSATIDITQDLIATGERMFDVSIPHFQSGLANILGTAQTVGHTIEQSAKTTSNAMVSSFTSGLLKMAEGTQTFGQLVRNLGNQMAQHFLKTVVDPMISGWLRGIQASVTATIFGNAKVTAANDAAAAHNAATNAAAHKKSITGDAAAAAGAAYRAMSGIPPAPLWGALASAAAYAGVMAFEGMVPSASGGWDIPAGLNPLAQLHAQEMVLPARYANPMRDMLSSFSVMQAKGFAPANDGSNIGDTHVHLHMGAGADGPSLQRWFDQHGDKMAKSLSAQSRRGVKFA